MLGVHPTEKHGNNNRLGSTSETLSCVSLCGKPNESVWVKKKKEIKATNANVQGRQCENERLWNNRE